MTHNYEDSYYTNSTIFRFFGKVQISENYITMYSGYKSLEIFLNTFKISTNVLFSHTYSISVWKQNNSNTMQINSTKRLYSLHNQYLQIIHTYNSYIQQKDKSKQPHQNQQMTHYTAYIGCKIIQQKLQFFERLNFLRNCSHSKLLFKKLQQKVQTKVLTCTYLGHNCVQILNSPKKAIYVSTPNQKLQYKKFSLRKSYNLRQHSLISGVCLHTQSLATAQARRPLLFPEKNFYLPRFEQFKPCLLL
eukprot:TRINITY_DN20136_c0_g1_i5.p1 TRINITY_DN20136_c0_g1~~TRINITY_DN20136_c0_g1_i5.p1  ORF type:complete len:247 (+),score=-21.89 TRINITY_DN20136_c0_g1_i5:1057-1797(+)